MFKSPISIIDPRSSPPGHLNRENICVNAEPIILTEDILELIHSTIEQFPSVNSMFPSFQFRKFAQSYLPEIVLLAKSIRSRLDDEQHAVHLRGHGLVNFEPRIAEFLFLSLTNCIGVPTHTDRPNGKILWEVRPRNDLSMDHKPTITETKNAAGLHTDSSYRQQPERYTSLFCIRPARDGGGLTNLLHVSSFLAALQSIPAGAACEETLRNCKFPFRVPDSFTAIEDRASLEFITAPILGNYPAMRYRYDSIMEGLIGAKSSDTEEIAWALRTVETALTLSESITIALEQGDLLFLNNHTVLHGRTSFSDSKRLLLRVRMQQASEILPQ